MYRIATQQEQSDERDRSDLVHCSLATRRPCGAQHKASYSFNFLYYLNIIIIIIIIKVAQFARIVLCCRKSLPRRSHQTSVAV